MGAAISKSSTATDDTRKADEEEWWAVEVEAFALFVDACCTATKHGFVTPGLLQSAWVSYNARSANYRRRALASDLALASGYTMAGNGLHSVILGVSLVHWPHGSLQLDPLWRQGAAERRRARLLTLSHPVHATAE